MSSKSLAENIILSKKNEQEVVTPTMQQFLAIKARHADCMLFYRMGDFYELFFDDAVKAANILDIALTKRGKHNGEDIPMCGVPVHSHEAYLEKLIRAGVRIAICEQLEEPAEAKKRGYKAIIARDVVRIVTPGTITEENLLDSRQANYLAVVVADAQASSGSYYIISWLDISTGEFNVTSVSRQALAMELARINPRELLIPETMTTTIELQDFKSIFAPQPDSLFDARRAERLLKETYNLATLDSFGEFSSTELSACGALLDYVKLTQKSKLPRLDVPHRENIGEHMLIDAASQRNLELMVTLAGKRKGSLFSVIDKTITSAGARLLAVQLSAPQTDVVAINERLDNVQIFVEQSALCKTIREFLKECPDIERALSRLCLGRGGPRDVLSIAAGLNTAQSVREELELRSKDLPNGLVALSPILGGHEVLIENIRSSINMEDVPMLARDGNFIKYGYSKELDELRGLRDRGQKLVVDLQQKYITETGIASLKIRFNNMLGYFVEITAQHQSKIINDFIHRQTLANNLRYSTVELSELERKINEAAGNALKLEQEIFSNLLAEIIAASEKIILSARALAQIDVSTSLAHLAENKNYIRPVVDSSLAFDICGGRHPVVEASLQAGSGVAFIGNNCNLENSQRLWLLTGPNMAGKSTFLRQNALISILAQAGSFVPAQSANIGVVDRLFSRVGAADDLARGHSTFMVEMVETATILHQATSRSLVILDEIGRGTATFDGLSIAWAVVEHLHNTTKCRGLFATHYHELTELTSSLPALSTHTMKVKEWKGELIFLHEVAAGSADRSYGIHVARLAGIPASVITRAADILHQLEKEQRSAPHLAESLPLFSYVPPESKSALEIPAQLTALSDEVKNLSPDNFSPREALEMLYKLKEIAG
ncbi:MAG: DNA mismatch repair protein MutS [Rickettsiales bacterium]|jgi:DNA mismatch repair protein MutS